MTFYHKYSQFNEEKNADYINMCMQVVNEGLEISNRAGIKTFMWHHELDLPAGFGKAFPDVLNENGDVEVSHPLIADFLKNKILDFFYAYPMLIAKIRGLSRFTEPTKRNMDNAPQPRRKSE